MILMLTDFISPINITLMIQLSPPGLIFFSSDPSGLFEGGLNHRQNQHNVNKNQTL